MNWQVRTLETVDQDLSNLAPEVVEEAIAIIEDLAESPLPDGCIPMRGYNNVYRLRFGGDAYRIVYRVDFRRNIVSVLRVRPRGSAYRGMKG